ncbi:hypothetical protein SADUNF_Sadunf16G0291600 [Salix dunnii]|uniref:Uncharacterized protein n=1 Tax=Salix dunnii TaxID=1413687 RepID=A0A835MHV4_9ROSI|nr:hypothetical protein SADUNF_Sadunf16G0291600 [Salix dunnii]
MSVEFNQLLETIVSCSYQYLNYFLLSGGKKLAGILIDTGNLTSPHCKAKDKYMYKFVDLFERYGKALRAGKKKFQIGEASVDHDCIGREILVSGETMELTRNLLLFFPPICHSKLRINKDIKLESLTQPIALTIQAFDQIPTRSRPYNSVRFPTAMKH